MNKLHFEINQKESQNIEFKKEWDDLEVESKLDYADNFVKNHDKRLTHDEVFSNVRSRISKI